MRHADRPLQEFFRALAPPRSPLMRAYQTDSTKPIGPPIVQRPADVRSWTRRLTIDDRPDAAGLGEPQRDRV